MFSIFKRDPVTGSPMIRAGLLVRANDRDAVVELLKKRVLDVIGEWFEDSSRGVGYFSEDDADILKAQIRARIAEVPGVAVITRFDATTSDDTLTITRCDITTDDNSSIRLLNLNIPATVAA